MAKRKRVKGRKVRGKVTNFYSKKHHYSAKRARYIAGAVVWKIRKNKARRHHR